MKIRMKPPKAHELIKDIIVPGHPLKAQIEAYQRARVPKLRMTECENDLLEVCGNYASVIYAWCILPNHFHIMVRTDRLKELRKEIGRFHGRSSFKWNGEDHRRGRQVWQSEPEESASEDGEAEK